ncbi:hypothetical protein KKH39_00865 [Patescibacteria group bacterium]|nr:hypothetical protein [Patescibacteria group bacterium]
MKKLLFCAILLALVAALVSGCTTPGKKWYGYDRQSKEYIQLDKQPFQQAVYNLSSYTIFFTLEGKDAWSWTDPYYQIDPGYSGSLEIHQSYTSDKFRAYFWCKGCQDVLGTTEEMIEFELPGLATMPTDTLIVTDAMLMGDALQEMAVKNMTGVDLHYYDNRGNDFVIKHGQAWRLLVLSGPYNFWVEPVIRLKYEAAAPVKLGQVSSDKPLIIDRRRNALWTDQNGQPIYIGAKRIIGADEIPRFWRERRHWAEY